MPDQKSDIEEGSAPPSGTFATKGRDAKLSESSSAVESESTSMAPSSEEDNTSDSSRPRSPGIKPDVGISGSQVASRLEEWTEPKEISSVTFQETTSVHQISSDSPSLEGTKSDSQVQESAKEKEAALQESAKEKEAALQESAKEKEAALQESAKEKEAALQESAKEKEAALQESAKEKEAALQENAEEDISDTRKELSGPSKTSKKGEKKVTFLNTEASEEKSSSPSNKEKDLTAGESKRIFRKSPAAPLVVECRFRCRLYPGSDQGTSQTQRQFSQRLEDASMTQSKSQSSSDVDYSRQTLIGARSADQPEREQDIPCSESMLPVATDVPVDDTDEPVGTNQPERVKDFSCTEIVPPVAADVPAGTNQPERVKDCPRSESVPPVATAVPVRAHRSVNLTPPEGVFAAVNKTIPMSNIQQFLVGNACMAGSVLMTRHANVLDVKTAAIGAAVFCGGILLILSGLEGAKAYTKVKC